MRQFLVSRLTDAPGLAAVAARFGLSDRHLRRRFRVAFGLSPGAYLLRARLELASHHLATEDATVDAIARRGGWRDGGDLARACRRHLGRSPEALRREARKRI